MVFLNQILFKYYKSLGIRYILYYLDIHQKEFKSIHLFFLAQLLFVARSNVSWAPRVSSLLLPFIEHFLTHHLMPNIRKFLIFLFLNSASCLKQVLHHYGLIALSTTFKRCPYCTAEWVKVKKWEMYSIATNYIWHSSWVWQNMLDCVVRSMYTVF